MFQFYPENSHQIEMITTQSMKAGFTGGIIVDFPNSAKAKKYFLVLMTGGGAQQMPKALGKKTGLDQSGIKFQLSALSFFQEPRTRTRSRTKNDESV